MPDSYRLLRIFSIAFKILALIVLVLLGTGLVGLFVIRRDPEIRVTPQEVANMIFSGTAGFLVFYALGDLIRLLLDIRKHLPPKEP